MRVLVVAASGGLGSTILRLAVEAGHDVTALVRSEERLRAKVGEEILSRVHVFIGDAQNNSDLREACSNIDTVIEALANDSRELAIPALVRAAGDAGAKNVVATGGVPALMKLALPAAKFKEIVEQFPLVEAYAKIHLQTFKALSESSLPAWCELCPGTIIPARSGKPSGKIGAQATGQPDWSVPEVTSYEDTAAIMLSVGADIAASGFNKQLVGLKNLGEAELEKGPQPLESS